MIKPDMIPDEVINAYMHMIVYGGVDGAEAIAAALNAWPGVGFKMNGAMRTFYILPLPQKEKGGQ